MTNSRKLSLTSRAPLDSCDVDAEIEEATSVAMGELRDPQADEDRCQKAETLVLIGVCTRARPPLSATSPPRFSQRRTGTHSVLALALAV